jgi:hypothetical protein
MTALFLFLLIDLPKRNPPVKPKTAPIAKEQIIIKDIVIIIFYNRLFSITKILYSIDLYSFDSPEMKWHH